MQDYFFTVDAGCLEPLGRIADDFLGGRRWEDARPCFNLGLQLMIPSAPSGKNVQLFTSRLSSKTQGPEGRNGVPLADQPDSFGAKWRPPRETKKWNRHGRPTRNTERPQSENFKLKGEDYLDPHFKAGTREPETTPKRGKRKVDTWNAKSFQKTITRGQTSSALKCQRRESIHAHTSLAQWLLSSSLCSSPLFSFLRGLPFCFQRI